MVMSMRRAARVGMLVRMEILVVPVHIEFYATDARLLASRDMDVPAVELEFFQFVFERMSTQAQVDHRAEKHVAADAAEDVEVKRFHWSCDLEVLGLDPPPAAASSLIWLAA